MKLIKEKRRKVRKERQLNKIECQKKKRERELEANRSEVNILFDHLS